MVDFFIAGAPKCGTTALFTYLESHPSVFMSAPKEPRYYCKDLHTEVQDKATYLNLFLPAPRGSVTGEASPTYLYSQVAIPEIATDWPNAKFVIALRNPIDAAYSLHSQLTINWVEQLEDFEDAWRMQEARLRDVAAGRPGVEWQMLQYGAVFRFAPQIERLFEYVSKERCHFIIYEEFFRSPETNYRNLLNFLGLPDDGRQRFPRINPRTVPRSQLLQELLRPDRYLPKFVEDFLRSGAHRLGMHPRVFLRNLNSKAREGRPITPEFQRELAAFFDDDILATAALIGKNLDLWRQAAAP